MNDENDVQRSTLLAHTRAADENASESRTSRTIRTIRTTGASYQNHRQFADRNQRVCGNQATHCPTGPTRPAESAVGRSHTRQRPPTPVCGGVSLQTPVGGNVSLYSLVYGDAQTVSKRFLPAHAYCEAVAAERAARMGATLRRKPAIKRHLCRAGSKAAQKSPKASGFKRPKGEQ